MTGRIFLVLFSILVLISGNPVHAKSSSDPEKGQLKPQPDVQREIKVLQDSVLEVRRDQLNYQIERDLLKETYSSNFQTINLTLTLILGAFTILGFLGLKSIGSLREDFLKELAQFKSLKSELERQLKEVEKAQAATRTQAEKLTAENEEQDRRLKILEIREKATSLMRGGDFGTALEYLKVAYNIAPNEEIILTLQSECFSKLGRTREATEVCEKMITIDPANPWAITNLVEYYALLSRWDDHDRMIKEHGAIIEKRSPILPWYFAALRIVSRRDAKALEDHVKKLLDSVSGDRTPKITGWYFGEVRSMLSRQHELPGVVLLMKALDFLEGQCDGAQLLAAISPAS